MSITYKRYKKGDAETYALGTTLTIELLKNKPELCTAVIFHSAIDGVGAERIKALCKINGIPIITSDKIINTLSDKENCYAIGVFHTELVDVDKTKDHIVLVNPSDRGNMGTIMRTAVGFGINDLVIITPAVDIFDPKTIRSSMGAMFDLRISRFASFEEYVTFTGARNHYPFMLDASLPISDIEFVHPSSLIFGNEASGLPPEFQKVGQPIIINITDKVDSLNLPIACGIALFKFTEGNLK